MAKNAVKAKGVRPAPIKWEIRSAQTWDNGGTSFAIDFVLEGGRKLTVYNCRVVDGEKQNFISFPARKGKDGKYYSYAYIRLTDEEQEEIIQAALEAAEDEDNEE